MAIDKIKTFREFYDNVHGFMLKIGGMDTRTYLSTTEANRIKTYMIKVMVAAIIMYETGKKTNEKIEGELT